MKFNLEKFKKGELIVHCNTEKEREHFLKYLHNNGIKWMSGDSLLNLRKDLLNRYYFAIESFGGQIGLVTGLSISSFDEKNELVEWGNEYMEREEKVRIFKTEENRKSILGTGKIKEILNDGDENIMLIELDKRIDGEKFLLSRECNIALADCYFVYDMQNGNNFEQFIYAEDADCYFVYDMQNGNNFEQFIYAEDVAKYLLMRLSYLEITKIAVDFGWSYDLPFVKLLEEDIYDNLAYEYGKKKKYGRFIVKFQ